MTLIFSLTLYMKTSPSLLSQYQNYHTYSKIKAMAQSLLLAACIFETHCSCFKNVKVLMTLKQQINNKRSHFVVYIMEYKYLDRLLILTQF